MTRKERSSGTSQPGLPDWETTAARLGVTICPGPPSVQCGSTQEQHRNGFVKSGSPPTVHWGIKSRFRERGERGESRLTTRRGMYVFLKLCYRALHPEVWHMPKWQQVYEESRAAISMGLSIGVRIGRQTTELDRAKVKFALSDPDTRDEPIKEQAWRWSEKRYD